jgi:hypothetical protein
MLRTDLVQRPLDRLYLADDVDAVRVLLHHTDDAAQVSFNGLQSSDCAFVFHGFLSFSDHASQPLLTPPPGGMG